MVSAFHRPIDTASTDYRNLLQTTDYIYNKYGLSLSSPNLLRITATDYRHRLQQFTTVIYYRNLLQQFTTHLFSIEQN
jgi:hypothetical protein